MLATSYYHYLLQNHSIKYSDKGHWYAISYPVIIQLFEATRFEQTESNWVQRLAMVGSWLPTIINPKLSDEAIRELQSLEERFYNVKLEEIGEEIRGERIFKAPNLPAVSIQDFVKATYQITSGAKRFDGNLSTTTKLLHFMHPHLFPIYDKKIHNRLFNGEGQQTYQKYHAYIFALRKWLEDNKETRLSLLKRLAREMNVSVIRIIDCTLFYTEEDLAKAGLSKITV